MWAIERSKGVHPSAMSSPKADSLARVLPESAPVRLDAGHVLFKTFYIVDRPVGRVLGPPEPSAILRGKNAHVIFFDHDLPGPLAPRGEGFALAPDPRGLGAARTL